MMYRYALICLLLLTGMMLSVIYRKLDIAGAVVGGICGFLVYLGAGYTGILIMSAFFILATVATSWKMRKKERAGLVEKNRGQRTAGQVMANAGVAAFLGLLAWLYPVFSSLFQVMVAAAFSSATADTLSSELGNIYGSRFYNIISFKKDQRGLDGVISLEGTLAGMAGSIVIAFIYALGFDRAHEVIVIVVAGTIGNLSDSVLGATVERRRYLGNNAVNFLNTLIAALAALLCSL